MSGMFGQLLGGVLGGAAQDQSPVAGILHELMSGAGTTPEGQQGGVGSLISRFESAGLGDIARSWVGTGGNAPISAEQLASVVPADKLQEWAGRLGTTPDAMLGMLTQALPHAVDHVTPDGQVPSQGTDLSSLIGGFLRR